MNNTIQTAMFAGGCFWCMVKPFDQWDGIESVISGYSGGHVDNPTYEDVKSGASGHYEVVQITFDPNMFSYDQLPVIYRPPIDPTDAGGQFQDSSDSYRTAIFYHNEEQKHAAEKSKAALAASGKFKNPIVTELPQAIKF